MRHFIGMTLALSLLGAAPAIAADAMDIVKKANHASYYVGDDGRAKVAMTITDDQGRAREREFVILRKDEDETDGPQNFYVYFNKPADVKKWFSWCIRMLTVTMIAGSICRRLIW